MGLLAASDIVGLALSAPLASLNRRAPFICREHTSLQDVLQIMVDSDIGAIIAMDGRARPLSIFTLRDVLPRVLLPGLSLETPLGEVMTRHPVSLPPAAPAFEATLLMAQHGFRHILIAEESGPLLGVVSERDLFASQRVGLR